METYAPREEKLVEGLQFTLKEQSSLIASRREVSFTPVGASTGISPTNTRIVRFQLASEGWLVTNYAISGCDE